ncbi:MAG TPA: glycosyltransferase [Candidatus Hydrogenedentes bacterium]|nr:glycosyltransferase [Candidatus Hydrogenedentota bacterium]HOS04086.1 glycosyltransferase [Candidatus Hydrogenedentota bacterium]
MTTPSQFTVAVCTRNRAHLLPTVVQSIARQDFPDRSIDILIVDNDSTDKTPRVLQQLSEKFPGVRGAREPRRGIGHARNRAIEEARGEWLVYIDDDAEMLPGYFAALDRVLQEENDIGAVGGPIEVGWLGPVPAWYEPALDGLFNKLDIASYRTTLRYPQEIYTTNFAARASLLSELGGFRADLAAPGSGVTAEAEDAEMALRIQTVAGLRILWDPAMRVRHYVQPERLTPAYMIAKAEQTGRARCRIERAYPGHGGVSRAWAGLAEWAARKLAGRTRGPLTERVHLATAMGYLKEWRRPSAS